MAGRLTLILLFLALLFAPSVNGAFHLFPESPSYEKRELAQKPAFDPVRWTEFPAEFERYYNDRFSFRNDLVRLNYYLRIRWLKFDEAPSLLVGKENWLYLRQGNLKTGISKEDLYESPPFLKPELRRMREALENRRKKLADQGIAYFIMITPDKSSVYPEYLPDRYRLTRNSRLDQLMREMQSSELTIIDLRSVLLEAKKEAPVYYRTDSHWNDYGAYLAYLEAIKALKKLKPDAGIKPVEHDFRVEAKKPDGDLAVLAMVDYQMKEETVSMTPKEGSVPVRAPFHAFLLGDSFMKALSPYLEKHFEKFSTYESNHMEYIQIDQKKPDILIHAINERFLNKALLDE